MGQQERDGWGRSVAKVLAELLQRFCGAEIVRVRVGKALKLYGADIFRFLSHRAWHVGQKEGFVFLQVLNLQGLHDIDLVLRSDDTQCVLGGEEPE